MQLQFQFGNFLIMSGLFLSFDGFVFYLPMLSLLTFLLFLFPNFYGMNKIIIEKLMKAIGSSFGEKLITVGSITWFCSSLFVTLVILNTFSLLPFVYCLTAIPTFSLFLSLQVWMWVLMTSICFNFSKMMAHFTPKGAPIGLASALVVIEIISYFIRAITLGVRLMANMTSGHILVALLSSVQPLTLSWALQSILFLLEILVSVVQAYVFSMLTYIYIMES